MEEVTAATLATSPRPQDNRGFTDTNTAQKLTEGDILKMKNDGKGGRAIIQVGRSVIQVGRSVIRQSVLLSPQACFDKIVVLIVIGRNSIG